MPTLAPGSPPWWLDRLEQRLNQKARRERLQKLTDYYAGNHPLLFATEDYQSIFLDLLRPLAINFVSLVVDSAVERLRIQGFRSVGRDGSDPGANAIWRDNDMDAWSVVAHREALSKSETALIVWPGRDGKPTISVEDARTIVVEWTPGNVRRRQAALKRWADDTKSYATLYLPDAIYKFEQPLGADAKARIAEGNLGIIAESTGGWIRRDVPDEEWPLPNPTGEVPVIPMVNRPDLFGIGTSEMDPVLPQQNAINKLGCDLIIASEFAAYPQRWMTGVQTIDPETGEDKFDFRGFLDRILTVENPDARMGIFQAADLSNYTGAIDVFVQEMASISHTPPHYLLGRSGVIPSGESVTAAESGLVSKVRNHQSEKGPVWSEVQRLALRMMGNESAPTLIPIWEDPERRSWSERADAVAKEVSLGVPLEFLLPKLGYSPEEVQRIIAMRHAEELQMSAAKVDQLRVLVQTGFRPDAAAAALNVPIEHTGEVPVTLQPVSRAPNLNGGGG